MLKIGDFGLATSSNEFYQAENDNKGKSSDKEFYPGSPTNENNFKLHFSIKLKENVGTPLYQSNSIIINK